MAKTKRFGRRRTEESASKKVKNLPSRVFLTLLLVALVVAWSYLLGIANNFVLALAIILIYFFAVAAITSALTLRAPTWLLVVAISFGLIISAVGIYFRIEEPDGILTPFLIPLGGGIILAELAVATNRYWNDRS